MITASLLLVSMALAKPAAPTRLSHPRVYIPEDSDPCDYERFKPDSYLDQWMREISPTTATSTRCYLTPDKLLPVVSKVLTDLDHGALVQRGGPTFDARAAALIGYRLDALIDVTRDGRRQIGLIYRHGGNGPTAGQVFTPR